MKKMFLIILILFAHHNFIFAAEPMNEFPKSFGDGCPRHLQPVLNIINHSKNEFSAEMNYVNFPEVAGIYIPTNTYRISPSGAFNTSFHRQCTTELVLNIPAGKRVLIDSMESEMEYSQLNSDQVAQLKLRLVVPGFLSEFFTLESPLKFSSFEIGNNLDTFYLSNCKNQDSADRLFLYSSMHITHSRSGETLSTGKPKKVKINFTLVDCP